ncbi:MAG TPA: MFS transporter [Candidatus Acidoferrum sp.]|nr:MFS transporter [Candidatus Acidoferrum sp.]
MTALPTEEYSPRSYRIVFEILFVGFLLSGIIGTLIGPILPTYIARWSLNDSGAGFFLTAMYIGSLTGTLISSVVISRGGYKPTLALGYGLAAIGTAALIQPNYKMALAATVVYGVGYGLLVPATNLWVAEYSGHRRASALNLLNLAWGIGAMGWPPLALYAIRGQHLVGMLTVVGVASLVLALGILWSPFLPYHRGQQNSNRSDETKAPGLWVAAGLAFLFFIYVGTENGISQWSAAHAKRVLAPGDPSWTLAPMLFFFGLLGGRALASVVLLRVKEIWVVYGGLILAGAATVVTLSAKTRSTLFAGVCAAGLGCSGVYPVFVAWLAKWFGTKARSMGGVMFSLAALGGASLPWLVGFVSKETSSLRIGLWVPVAGCASMLAVTALLRPKSRH